MRKNIGIDYDGTFTDNPECWSIIITQLRISGYSVYCTSARTHNQKNYDELIKALPNGTVIILTSHRPKIKYCEELGIHIDIWIDNEPMALYVDDRTLGVKNSE